MPALIQRAYRASKTARSPEDHAKAQRLWQRLADNEGDPTYRDHFARMAKYHFSRSYGTPAKMPYRLGAAIPRKAPKLPRRVCLVEGSIGVEAVYTIKSFDYVPGRAYAAEPVAVKRIKAETKREADMATKRYVKEARCALMSWEKFEQKIGHDLARSVRRSSYRRGIPICKR